MSSKSKYFNDKKLKDAWLHGMAEAALLLNNRLNKYEFKINVKDQCITVFGEVNTRVDEWLCIELLKGIEEFKNITNQLTVVEVELSQEINTLTSRQAFLLWTNDINISAEVKTKLLWNSALSGKEIEVYTKNGEVTLTGEVDYVANKAMAEIITSNIVQVQKVHNKIVVNS